MAAFVRLFSTEFCQMCPQSTWIGAWVVTLVAFVRLFPIVCFHMSAQITWKRGYIFTLIAFLWFFHFQDFERYEWESYENSMSAVSTTDVSWVHTGSSKFKKILVLDWRKTCESETYLLLWRIYFIREHPASIPHWYQHCGWTNLALDFCHQMVWQSSLKSVFGLRYTKLQCWPIIATQCYIHL